jgi:predicted MPP superfamily phosphohydrolase
VRLPQVLVFLCLVLGVDGLITAFLLAHVGDPLTADSLVIQAARAAIWVCFFVVPGTFVLMPWSGRRWADLLQHFGYLVIGFWSLILVFLVLRDGVWLLGLGLEWLGVPALPVDPLRRGFLLHSSNAAILGLAASVTALGWWNSRRLAAVIAVDIPIDGLPEALDGFRIVQISDLHVGPTVHASQMQAVADRVNGLRPDLVAVTGDMVDGSVEKLASHVAPLGSMQSRHGTWFVTGNHEYYSGVEAWLAHIRGPLGMRVLEDEHALIEHGGATVLIAGVTDITAPHMYPAHVSSPTKATVGAPPADFRLLLAHQPESAREAEPLGFQLQLSGHTHGGQYWPFTVLIRLGKRWVRGLYRFGGLWIYVSAGTTYWGPPLRLGSPQEISLLTLRRSVLTP